MIEYIVIQENPLTASGSGYSWDGVRFATQGSAGWHGEETADGGDFIIGIVEDDRLLGATWKFSLAKHSDDVAVMAAALGLHSDTRGVI